MQLANPDYPNLPDFTIWVPIAMRLPDGIVVDDQTLEECYNEAYTLTLWPEFATIPGPPGATSTWALAVYNYGGALIVSYATDAEGSTYWDDQRNKYGVNYMGLGIITSTSDQGTSQGSQMPRYVDGMLLGDIMLSKTPWGQRYLAYASSWGTIWGIT